MLTFSKARLFPTPPYTNPRGLLNELFPTTMPEFRLIFATEPAAGGTVEGRVVNVVVVVLPGARPFGWRLATDPSVTALFNGTAPVFELEGEPFPRQMALSSFALGIVLETPIASVAESMWRVKPRVVAGRDGGGAFSFSRASERFDKPVCFD